MQQRWSSVERNYLLVVNIHYELKVELQNKITEQETCLG